MTRLAIFLLTALLLISSSAYANKGAFSGKGCSLIRDSMQSDYHLQKVDSNFVFVKEVSND